MGERRKPTPTYAQQVRAFQTHALVSAGSVTIVVAVNLLTNLAASIADEWNAWWSVWAVLGSSAGLMVHGLVVWINRPSAPSTETPCSGAARR